MRCPYCSKNHDRVVDSRESRDGVTIRRRRECLKCQRRFTSYEQIEDIAYLVVKSDGRREEFNRGKLLSGLRKACEKRPISSNTLEAIVEAIDTELHQRENREISAREIGTSVMAHLKQLDAVAYVRFASVYRRFEDVGAFVQEVQSLLGSPVVERADATSGTTESGTTESGNTESGNTESGTSNRGTSDTGMSDTGMSDPR